MQTRADKIYQILKKNSGRLKVAKIVEILSKIDNATELEAKVISATVHADNNTRQLQGKTLRFNRFGDGTEKYGYVSITNLSQLANDLSGILRDYEYQIPAIIEKANLLVRNKIKVAIRKLPWQEFETHFLLRILEALGFKDITITKRTKDGGTDAYCTYRRSMVTSSAIVSAKHWKSNVGPEEVQRLRGIKGHEDTGIIITSASFTAQAIKEAEPSQNQRAIYLFDIDAIVETCFEHSIGAECISVPKLYKFNKTAFNYQDNYS